MKANMISNLEKYKKDLEDLIKRGEMLLRSLKAEFLPKPFREELKEIFKDEEQIQQSLKKLPSFTLDYQIWYSEALVLLKRLLPDRVDDFVSLYKKPKTKRKEITPENYVIEDALKGLRITCGLEKREVVGPSAAIYLFIQQLNILKSLERRFESSLFDIRQLVQADLFDSELDAARELNKKGFTRGAGAIAGVVLEKHLLQVCTNHNLIIKKKKPTISDYNYLLKENDVIDVPTWRFIQLLADLRNLCDHKREKEPTKDDVEELINGIEKITKTVY